MAPLVLESRCPKLYHDLPMPVTKLDLCYQLWGPGFKYREPVKKIPKAVETAAGGGDGLLAESAEAQEEEQEAALEALVEADEIKDMFSEINGGNDISPEQASNLARKMGLAPSVADIKKWEKENGKEMNCAQFKKFLLVITHPEDNVDGLVPFFEAFDPTREGKLPRKTVKNLLLTWAEGITEPELDQIFSALGEKSDMIDYRQFLEKLLKND